MEGVWCVCVCVCVQGVWRCESIAVCFSALNTRHILAFSLRSNWLAVTSEGKSAEVDITVWGSSDKEEKGQEL